MDTNTQPAADRVYEDFEAPFEWARDEESVTLIVMLPGYRRHQLRVQVTSKPALKIIGQRQITDNRWRRFNREFPIPSDCDSDNVNAKFEGGKLLVKFAKLVKPKETSEVADSRPKQQAPPQEVEQQKDAQEVTPKPKEEKAEARSTNDQVSEKTPQKEKDKEPASDEKEKSKTETVTSSIDKVAQKKVRTNGLTDTKETTTSKAAETVTRTKTRLLDFTLSLRPTKNQDYNDDHGDLEEGINKRNKLVKWVVIFLLLVVGLGLFARKVFRSSLGESKFQEL